MLYSRFVLATVIVCFTATSAHAGGALSKVVGGMKHKSGQDGDDRAAPEGPRGDDGETSSDADTDGGDSHYAGGGGGYSTAPTAVYVGGYPGYGGRADVRLELGLHRVDDSNGAAYASVRASHGEFGIEMSDTAYYEEVQTMDGVDTLDLHVWAIGGAYRITEPRARTAIWVAGGLAGATSDGLQLYGGYVGGQLLHHVKGAVGLEASARLLMYQDDIRGTELRGGIAASILRFGYRHTEFNVGPPLKGPEVGVALQF